MTLWPLFALPVLAVVWIAVNRRLTGDPLSPFNLLYFSWIGPLILQMANLSGLETAWDFGSTLAVVWTTITLVAISVLATAFVSRRFRTADAVAAYETLLATFRRPAVLVPFIGLHVMALGALVYAEFITNPAGVPLVTTLTRSGFAGIPGHRWGKDSRWQILVALLFILTPMAFLAYEANRGRALRVVLLCLALLYPVLGVLKLSRSDVFIGMLMIGAAAMYHSAFTTPGRSRSTVRVLRLTAIGVAALAVSYTMLSMRIASVPIENQYAGFIGFRPADGLPLRGLFAAVYGYLAMPFENLHRMIEANSGALHLGVSVLRPFLSISGLGDLADRLDARILYPPPVSAAAGSATFLTAVIAELGIVGVAIVPAAYALLVNALYIRMRNRPTLLNLMLYLNFVYPWVWLFFNNAFSVMSIYLNAGFVMAAVLIGSECSARIRMRSASLTGSDAGESTGIRLPHGVTETR